MVKFVWDENKNRANLKNMGLIFMMRSVPGMIPTGLIFSMLSIVLVEKTGGFFLALRQGLFYLLWKRSPTKKQYG